MPETNTPTVAFVTNRNGIDRNIVEAQFSRGDNKGKTFLKPEDVTIDNFDAAITWFGKQMVCDILNAKAAQMGQVITDQATSELDGQLDTGLAQKYFTEFSTRGETKAELEARLNDLNLKLVGMCQAGATREELCVVGDEIKSVLVAIESKKRERAPKTEVAAAS